MGIMRLNCVVGLLRIYFRHYKSVTSKPATCKQSRRLGISYYRGQNCEEDWVEKCMLFKNPSSASREIVMRDMRVIENFLNEEEERSLHEEVEPHMRRLRYEFDHWDDVSQPVSAA
ncbi:hypothetical protein Cfor_00497 [Coptotermes formosanus]|jgi:hypothetical protein|uniref:Uncharacterized protein n=1 Tax=Coptotermes formosanus TaxID=36987 RepID=A0A6L2Q7L8_COPFO|nr:hypothetical protein Cfor_00497 [Coptotermes formosanus]